MTIDQKSLMRIIACLSDEALIEAIRKMPTHDLCHLPYESAPATWRDSEGKEWTIEGKCLILGERAVMWTSSDQAGDDDHIVITAPADPVTAAQEYASEIAADL